MAAALVVALIAAVHYRYEHARQRADAAKYDAERAGQEIENRCVGSPDAIARTECLIQEMKATQEQKRSEEDLRAQQEMAEWAFGMFIATCFGVVITAVGIGFIAVTLKETRRAALFAARTLREARRATAAAVETTEEAKRIGEAQTRSYLRIVGAIAKLRHNNQIGERAEYWADVRFQVKNSGQTPAQYISQGQEVDIASMSTHSMPNDAPTNNLRADASMAGGADGVFWAEHGPFKDHLFQAVLRGDCAIIARIALSSQDVFGQWEIVKVGFFLNFETEGIRGDAIWRDHQMQLYFEKYETRQSEEKTQGATA